MRQIIHLMIVGLCIVLGISFVNAKTPVGEFEVKNDSLKMQLLPSLNHSINIVHIPSKKIALFTDTITLLKSQFEKKGVDTFILNKDFTVEKVMIEKTPVRITEYKKLISTNFEPRIRIQFMSSLNERCRVMRISKISMVDMPDTIRLTIKYHIPLQDSLKISSFRGDTLELKGWDFWYPRNLNHIENISLTVRTMSNYEALLDEQVLPIVQSGYSVIYKLEYQDPVDNPRNLIIKQKR